MRNRLQRANRPGQDANHGFSLVELLTVIAVSMVICAIAIPTVITSVANVRLRSGMSSLSGLIQRCRSEAIKNNTLMTVRFSTMGAGPVAYVKPAAVTSSLNNLDPQAQLGAPMTKMPAPAGGTPTALDGTTLWGSSSTVPDSTNNVSFNQRGMPCYYVSATSCASKGFVFYFTDSRPLGGNAWAALSVSPAGRVKVWLWNGSAWRD